jgi:pilus assembly protein CpaB
MNRRALLIALVVGILGVFLLLLYQRRFELEASGGEAKNAVVLLQRVLVLAMGSETSPDALDQKDKNAGTENLLTLSLTLSEAQIIALAAERGRLAVAVRHPDDQQKAGVTDINFDSILDAKKRGEIKGVRGGPVNITGGGSQ